MNELEELKTRIENLEAKSMTENAVIVKTTLKIRDIAAILKVSEPTLRKCKRYLLPNCAIIKEIDREIHSTSEWTFEEFYEWNSKPLEERKRIYAEYLKDGTIRKYWEKQK